MSKVEREITVAAGPDEVWRALTDEALLEWLAPEVELEPEEGGSEDGALGDVRRSSGHRLASPGGSRVELTVDAVSDGPGSGGRDRPGARRRLGPAPHRLASASALALA